MANPFKRDDSPYWWVNYRVNGQRKRLRTEIRHNDLKNPPKDSVVWEVCRSIEDRLTRQQFGLVAAVEPAPIEKFLRDYVVGRQNVTDSTRDQYNIITNVFVKWCGEKKLTMTTEITPAIAKDYFNHLVGTRSSGRTQIVMMFLASAWDEAKRLHCVTFEENPFRIPVKVKPTKPRSSFTPQELRTLFEDPQMPDWIRTAMRVGLYTACRIESIRYLCWEHIDWTLNVITFKKSKTGSYSVPMHKDLRAYLEPLRRDVGPLMPPEVLRFARGYMSQRFCKEASRLGITKSFHSFRHTMSTVMAQAGLERRISQAITNHKDAATHDHYVHHDAARLVNEINKVAFFGV